MAADYGFYPISTWSETILRKSTLTPEAEWGSAVSISGNYAIVGERYRDGTNGQNSGAAYIFERNTSTGAWTETTMLTGNDLNANDQFGISVAISGNYAIIGAYHRDINGIQNGAAYIFERNTSTGVWSQTAILQGIDPGLDDSFGVSVAISGNYAIVGQSMDDGSSNQFYNSGAAYIYERNTSTGVWSVTAILRASNLGPSTLEDSFGQTVAISGNYAIVGTTLDDGSSSNAAFNCGAAYIFERDGSGNWTEKTILRASNLGAEDDFACSLAIDGNYAIVGAQREDGTSNSPTINFGAAYIFERDSYGNWNEIQILRPSISGYFFGVSVAINGKYAIVGVQQEKAYIFERNNSGVWTQQYIFQASNNTELAGDAFGCPVAISGDYVIIGAILEDGSNNGNLNTGAVYILGPGISSPLAPTPISFVSNTLRIANSINSTDTDNVSFSLNAGTTLTSFNVSTFTGSGTITYNLDISGGANLVTAGTFTTTNTNLLTGGPLTASVNTTYILTFTANASITYSIFGLLVTGNFTYSKLITTGFTSSQIIEAGYNIATIADIKADGITDAQLFGAGYTFAEIVSAGFLPDWNTDANASHIIKSYVKDFVDISGSVVLRNNANLYVHGNAQLGGNLSLNRPAFEADLSFNNRIFVGGDVSMNGKVNIGGNVSLTGSVVNCSNVANNSVPQNAFNGSVSSGPDYTAARVAYRQNFHVNDDVSMNGTTVQANNVKVNGNIVFSDGTIMNSYDNNIYSTNPTVFKPSTFTSLAINGNLTAGSYSTSSDYRIKTEVAELDETFTVDNLRPVKYVQTLINKTQYGLIAHELQDYYPDLVVGEKDGDGWQRVNYTGLIAILINEIKRMKQDLAELEGEI